jgi:hypothetical protein
VSSSLSVTGCTQSNSSRHIYDLYIEVYRYIDIEVITSIYLYFINRESEVRGDVVIIIIQYASVCTDDEQEEHL